MSLQHRLLQRPTIAGLSAVLAVVLGFAALASIGAPAFAQTPGTPTATRTATATVAGVGAASPTAPTTGSGLADDGTSANALILVGGIAVVAASLAAMGYALRKRG